MSNSQTLQIWLRKSAPLFFVATLIFVMVLGLAHAAIPNTTTGRIEACMRNTAGIFVPQGNLRAIDVEAGQSCTSSESPISWSTQTVSNPAPEVFSDRVVVSYGDVNQPVFSIPNFGDITVGCSGLANENGIFYHNTTNNTISMYGKQNIILPGQSVNFDASNIYNGTKSYILSYFDGTKNHISRITFGGERVNSNPYPCIYAVIATVDK